MKDPRAGPFPFKRGFGPTFRLFPSP